MTSKRQVARLVRYVLAVGFTLSIVACSRSTEPDFCRDHHLVHRDHSDSVATLDIILSDDGLLTKELMVPVADGDSSSIGETFAMQADEGCSATESDVRRDNVGVHATYISDCGAGNRLRQIDVSIFEQLPDLEELEVTMKTPATQKHFVISRQCDRPIFRLE